MTDPAAVRASWPHARASVVGCAGWQVTSGIAPDVCLLGMGATEAEAWEDAAWRVGGVLHGESEPVDGGYVQR